jgi:hypothetical protein
VQKDPFVPVLLDGSKSDDFISFWPLANASMQGFERIWYKRLAHRCQINPRLSVGFDRQGVCTNFPTINLPAASSKKVSSGYSH